MENKIYATVDEAIADIPDGVSIALHDWLFCGIPSHLIAAIVRKGLKDITLLCTNFMPLPIFENDLPGPASLLPQLKRLITPGVATARHGVSPDFLNDLTNRVKSGQIEIEVIPHGIFIERLHAAAMGLGGFYEPVGLGTIVEEGKEKKVIDGKEYFLEKPFKPDVGLIKAYKADKLGNLIYRGSSRGTNPNIAMASKLTIVEVDELVEVGEIDPEMVVTPGLFVDRVVKIPEGAVGSAKRKSEMISNFLSNELLRKLMLAPAEKGDAE